MRPLMQMIAGAAALGFASSVQAATLAPFDQLFLRNEAWASAYELGIARLAQTRAARPDVKAYAATLVHDHEAFDAALRDVAGKKGYTLPPGPSPTGKAAIDRLAAHSGRGFDRAFIAEARRVNGADMRDFRIEASRTADADIGGFVAGYLPMQEQHEAAARALETTAVATGSRMPVIRPPTSGPMPVIVPPEGGKTPVIVPKQ